MKKTALSNRISDVMEKHGLTQQSMASLLQVSQPAISMYLQGRIPPANILHKIARIGETTVEWLLTGIIDSPLSTVQEKPAVYGNQHQLLELWDTLSPAVQKNLLMLMQNLSGKSGS
jgi:transcriptional regulator with XRE-family HTH domain